MRLRGSHSDPWARVVLVTLGFHTVALSSGCVAVEESPGADEDLVLPGCEIEGDPPPSPGPPAEVLEQLRLRPAPSAVDRDVDPRDMPLPTGERVAAHLDR